MNRIILQQYRGLVQQHLQHSRNLGNKTPQFVQSGFGKYIIILAPFITVGGVASYAKHDEDFRQMLIKNVPGIEQPLKYVLGEETPFKGVTDSFKGVSDTFAGISISITGLFGDDDTAKPKESSSVQFTKSAESKLPQVTKSIATPTKDNAIPVPAPTPPQYSAKSATAPVKENTKTSVSKSKSASKSETENISKLTPGELEKSIEVAATIAVQEYKKAINVLKSYNDEVKRVVDESIESNDNSLWNQLKNKTVARDNAVEQAEKSADEAFKNIRSLEQSIKSNPNVNSETAEALKRNVKNIQDHIELAKSELFKAKDLASIGEKYWKKVQSARNYFVDEMQALFPGIDLSAKKLNLSKEELDLFILHAYSHVLAYQKELQKLQFEGETKLRRALEALRGDDRTEALKTQLEFHLEKQQRDLAIANQKKNFKIRAEAEKELRLQMKRQAAAHTDHLQDAVELQVNEAKRKYERDLEEKLANEKAACELQVASMVGKWKGMNDALQARADSDSNAKQAQELWSACISLFNSVKYGDATLPWYKRIRPLTKEINTIESAAADGDKLVAAVLKTIPEEAKARGVYSEDALKERFFKVEKLARRLALVPEGGARLPMYMLSYIQSIFVVENKNISKDEIDNKEIDFKQLDTYDILGRARYWLDHGNIAQAVKYMNLLNGASYKVSSEWINEARIYLETQQAINALMAYAESSGY